MIHIVKGFSIVNEGEVDVFMEFSFFFYDPTDVANPTDLGPLPFLNPYCFPQYSAICETGYSARFGSTYTKKKKNVRLGIII